jgi:glucose/arabinose dehydrogenase
VAVEHAGDARLFVLEQGGRIRIIQDGILLPAPFLDISDRVGSAGNEQGLLGLAFHPQYPSNGFFFVNYTDLQGDTVIARFQVSADASQADPQSETRFLSIPQPFPNHNGGQVVFGPDGYLYLGLGDGGSAGDPQNNAQSTQNLLGKILRLDVGASAAEKAYGIPADNPFGVGGGAPEIWAYGLRNPWRFSFDRLTGDLFIADVGQNQWEEVNFLPAASPPGANFGWRFFEGSAPYEGSAPDPQTLVFPVAEYSHELGCSITGGYVYRGASTPEWQGIYFFGDYCSGLVFGLMRAADGSWEQRSLFDTGASISSFGEDSQGELFLVDLGGTIYRLEKLGG